MKKTPWYPAHVKPVRKGMYETYGKDAVGGNGKGFDYWNGKAWTSYVECRTPYISDYQNLKWRGVKK